MVARAPDDTEELWEGRGITNKRETYTHKCTDSYAHTNMHKDTGTYNYNM